MTEHAPQDQTAAREPSAAEQLRDLEPIFHRLPAGTRREEVAALVSEGFWEVGASGAVYTREHVLEALAERFETPHDDDWTLDDFDARELSPELWLVTYSLQQDRDRASRRSTIWRRVTGGGWRAEYHQGTLY